LINLKMRSVCLAFFLAVFVAFPLMTNVLIGASALRSLSHNESETNLHRLNIVIVAEARSASSLVLDMLQTLPSSFSFFEPFYHFLPPTASRDQKLPGSYLSLFNCRLQRHQDVNLTSHLFWEESCLRAGASWMREAMRIRCVSGNMTKADQIAIQNRCRESQIRIVKTVRFRSYTSRLPLEADPEMKVIHVVRHPADIAESWIRRGWGDRMDITRFLCHSMETKVALFANISKTSRYLLIRAEDLLTHPNTTFKASAFNASQQIDAVVQQLSQFVQIRKGTALHTSFSANANAVWLKSTERFLFNSSPRLSTKKAPSLSLARNLPYTSSSPSTVTHHPTTVSASTTKNTFFKDWRLREELGHHFRTHCKHVLSHFGYE
jgi:hypothetical protein